MQVSSWLHRATVRVTASLLVGVSLMTPACASLSPSGPRGSDSAISAGRRALSPQEVADGLRKADALVTDGCLECLIEAHDIYSRVESIASESSLRARRGATEAAILIATREHELGLEDSGRLDAARGRLSQLPVADRELLTQTLEILDALPGGASTGASSSERDLLRRSAVLRRRDEFRAALEPHADDSPLLAYAWLSVNCATRAAGDESVDSLLQRSPRWQTTTLLLYRAATCRATSATQLQELLAAHPRFVELRYFAGRQALQDGLPDEAIDTWMVACRWHPRWPALTLALADANLGIDEWDQALDFYERALATNADEPSALLGKARALTYLSRNEEALLVLDRLLALNDWYPGDARYWRALNETQLERYDAAWDDIERAATLIVGADVSKLAGIVAYRLGHSEVARSKFEEAWRRNSMDCEIGVHLSIVQSGLRAWGGALEALGRTAICLVSVERQLQGEIERIRETGGQTGARTATAVAPGASAPTDATAAAPRQAREVSAREARIATGRRLLATVWFNSAVASYYSARMDDARMFAERVVTDDEFGAPARTLLSRIP